MAYERVVCLDESLWYECQNFIFNKTFAIHCISLTAMNSLSLSTQAHLHSFTFKPVAENMGEGDPYQNKHDVQQAGEEATGLWPVVFCRGRSDLHIDGMRMVILTRFL